MVNLSLALLSTFTIIGALSGNADDVLPPHFNFDRYTAMVDDSPFALATAAVLPQATPDFAKDLYIANAARSPESDMVTIVSSSDHNFKKYLTTREPVDGYAIAQIEWSEDVGQTKVTISKDGNFATLVFNQALMAGQQTPPNARSIAVQAQAAPLVPPSVPVQASRASSQRVSQEDPEADPDDDLEVVSTPPPSLAATGVPSLDVSQGTDLQQLQLVQQRRQQRRDERVARERKQEEEALRK